MVWLTFRLWCQSGRWGSVVGRPLVRPLVRRQWGRVPGRCVLDYLTGNRRLGRQTGRRWGRLPRR